MKISSLKIKNFKAIKTVELEALGQSILIAGPNGSGKSCLFHAIRLLKSLIGGYQLNEWQLWFSEFQINPKFIRDEIKKLHNSPDRDMSIKAVFSISEEEKSFLRKEGKKILEYLLLRQHLPALDNAHYRERPLEIQYQPLLKKVAQETATPYNDLINELSRESFIAEIFSPRQGEFEVKSSIALQLIFSVYGEEGVGVLDYHGAHRDYQREELGTINLKITTDQSMKHHSLYNYLNKYKNIKQELAADFVRKLLKEKSGSSTTDGDNSLNQTLEELFETFFPGKKFLGPKANENGGVDFPVQLLSGKHHDLNDLSSGEKEVLYGYLRLRYSAPRNSIIMLDEPELHLNPRLITGLPRFYLRHLSMACNNQLLFVTHSDEFLRQAVNEPGFQVFHMQTPGRLDYGTNQLKQVNAKDELENALIDLVGDLAGYSPSQKVVILEGEDSEFDKRMLTKLYPEFSEQVNLVSAGSKDKVHKLHKLLEKASSSTRSQYYSIVDRDLSEDAISAMPNTFEWDVYHIENYLLDSKYVAIALDDLGLRETAITAEEVETNLKDAARHTIDKLVAHKVHNHLWNKIHDSICLKGDPNITNISQSTIEAFERSFSKLSSLRDDKFKAELADIETKNRTDFETSLTDGSWKSKLKGRDILRRFTEQVSGGLFKYEALRNTIIARMRADGYKPTGMSNTIDKILR